MSSGIVALQAQAFKFRVERALPQAFDSMGFCVAARDRASVAALAVAGQAARFS
jgi:hypothetical protein